MVNIFKKWSKAYRSAVLYIRCKRAIRKADRLTLTTGKKYLVLISGGRPVVISKQRIKALIKEGGFVKGFTPAKAEEIAIYIAR